MNSRNWIVPASVRLSRLLLPLFAAYSLLIRTAAGNGSPPGDNPADGGLRLELPAASARAGDRLELLLEAHTDAPLGVFALRVETAPDQLRLRSWTFGEGIQRHIALHGEPPVCDIIVYPDGSRLFAVMVMDPPFSSEEYGSGCLVLDFAVESEGPSVTCVLYAGDTPDYEPGDDLLTVISRMGPERSCAPVHIRPAPRIRRGDADGDGREDMTDAVGILQFLFLSGRRLDCADAADANDDGSVDVSDAVAVLRFLFQGAPSPVMGCGADRTRDLLPACVRPSC